MANDDLAVYQGSYINKYYGDDVSANWLSPSPRIWEGALFYDTISEPAENTDGTEETSDGTHETDRVGGKTDNEAGSGGEGADNEIDEPINRFGEEEEATPARKRRKRKHGKQGILSWVADQHFLNEGTAVPFNQTEARTNDIMAGSKVPMPVQTEPAAIEPGECRDDPEFRYTFSGLEVNCQWVQDNSIPGCGLHTDSVVAFQSCACACSEYRQF